MICAIVTPVETIRHRGYTMRNPVLHILSTPIKPPLDGSVEDE